MLEVTMPASASSSSLSGRSLLPQAGACNTGAHRGAVQAPQGSVGRHALGGGDRLHRILLRLRGGLRAHARSWPCLS